MLKNKIESMKSDWHKKYKSWILRKTKFKSIKRWWCENIKPYTLLELTLKYRKISLVLAGTFGIVLACYVYQFFSNQVDINKTALHGSLTILALGLPTFFILWLFRTHDVQENINNSTFFECARMLTEKYPEKNIEEKFPILADETGIPPHILEKSLPTKIALEQLAYLRRETGFDKERIELVTQQLKLGKMYLVGARLSGLNLTRAVLYDTRLSFADLSYANLTSSLLDKADLGGAKLMGANLTNTDTRETILSGAKYDKNTTFNSWLDTEEKRIKAGMVPYEPEEQK